jgi:transcriptional adapter 2-alpha
VVYKSFHVFVCGLALNEPGVQYQCDSCACDLTHTIRIKCADPVCVPGEGVDICPACFCAGKEFGNHRRGHPYRVIVSRYCYNDL